MNRLAPQLAFIAVTAAAACKETASNYCEDVPVTHNCLDKIDADVSCTDNAACATPTPVCDVNGSKTCVQCTADQTTACAGTTPACGDDHMCRACEAHSDCSSAACLDDGSCANESAVAYVDPSGTDNDTCSKAMPCTKVAKALATNRPYVKLTGTVDEGTTVAIDSQNVTLLADPGAKLVRTANGIVLEVKGTSQVTIHDLEISGGSGTQGIGISLPAGNSATLSLVRAKVRANAGGGIVSSGGALTVAQSIVSDNQGGGVTCSGSALKVSRSTVATNQGGGISITGTGATFDITNNFIYRNGDADNGTFGGVSLGIATAGSNRFDFNTVVDNRAAINSGGIICNVSAFAGNNNIVARNSLAGSTSSTNAQTSGACTYPTSKIQADVSGLAFEHPDAPAPFSYKLTASSSAIDQATTTSPIAVDYDGDVRPQGPQKDIGADEFK